MTCLMLNAQCSFYSSFRSLHSSTHRYSLFRVIPTWFRIFIRKIMQLLYFSLNYCHVRIGIFLWFACSRVYYLEHSNVTSEFSRQMLKLLKWFVQNSHNSPCNNRNNFIITVYIAIHTQRPWHHVQISQTKCLCVSSFIAFAVFFILFLFIFAVVCFKTVVFCLLLSSARALVRQCTIHITVSFKYAFLFASFYLNVSIQSNAYMLFYIIYKVSNIYNMIWQW